MAWVRFTRAWDWPPMASAHVAYQPRMTCPVPRACAEAAIAAGAAEAIATPTRAKADRLRRDPYCMEAADGGDRAPGGG
jgi:hypothetical protein